VLAVLHPQYNTQYFKDQSWPEEWITEACTILEDEWMSNYCPKDQAPMPTRNPAIPVPLVSVSRSGPG
ncbi:uncharacterized protein TRAVEDRAFT_132383, partial [Trametes versicolor FP-101664 SS1]|uniref:uncharacterized protein n=1 Tax=Trametes versicolor (strain FP-101664) TaxID=717944 RepID=UPI0004622FE9